MRKTLRALAAAALAVIAVAATATERDGRATPEAHFVSPAAQDVYYFGLAGNSRGDEMLWWIAWARFGHTRLYVRTKTAGASFGRPRALSGVHVSANEVHAAVGEDGTQLLTWTESGRGKTTQKAAARRHDGSFAVKTLSRASTPASTIYLGEASNLAIAHDGTAALAGVSFVRGTSQVVALVRSPKGHWSKPEVVTTGKRGVRYPVVAFDGAGTATLAWERGEREFPDNGAPRVKQQIRVAFRPPGGRFGKPRRVTKPQEDARDAALAVNARGDAALMWNATHGRNLPGSRIGIALRHAGGRFGKPRLITPPGESWSPTPAVGPTGSLTAVWSEDRKAANGYGCGCPRLVTAHGSVDHGLGPARALSPRTVEVESTATDRAGSLLSVWLQQHGDDFEDRPFARLAAADGTPGPLIRLGTLASRDNPQALLGRGGHAVAAWTRIRHARNRIELVHVRVRP